jgi:hypothetical protein
MTAININEYVWVELTDYGWQCLTSYYERLFAGTYAFRQAGFSVSDYVDMHKKETAPHTIDGIERMLTRFQLHDFMNTLGSKMYNGNKNVIEGNNLYFCLEG